MKIGKLLFACCCCWACCCCAISGDTAWICWSDPSRRVVRRATCFHRKSIHAEHASTGPRSYPNDDEDSHEPSNNSDWMQAELFLRTCPDEPDPSWSPELVARTVMRSLQWVDHPYKGAGLERCFDFLTYECRKAVTGRHGGDCVERFVQYGTLSPALQPFMGAASVELVVSASSNMITPAQPPFRGALISFPVRIIGAPILQLQYPSGLLRSGIAAQAPTVNMVLRLEQQRRPPLQDCWLVREVLDVRYAFAGDMGNDIPE